MSNNSANPQKGTQGGLGGYIVKLIARLDHGEPIAGNRLRAVVGNRSAFISVDRETVQVSFQNENLVMKNISVNEARWGATGHGRTDRQTVLALLGGYMEVTEAIKSGYLELFGTIEDIVRMGIALEILLDATSRIPSLLLLAEEYNKDPDYERFALNEFLARRAFIREEISEQEFRLLQKLKLLP